MPIPADAPCHVQEFPELRDCRADITIVVVVQESCDHVGVIKDGVFQVLPRRAPPLDELALILNLPRGHAVEGIQHKVGLVREVGCKLQGIERFSSAQAEVCGVGLERCEEYLPPGSFPKALLKAPQNKATAANVWKLCEFKRFFALGSSCQVVPSLGGLQVLSALQVLVVDLEPGKGVPAITQQTNDVAGDPARVVLLWSHREGGDLRSGRTGRKGSGGLPRGLKEVDEAQLIVQLLLAQLPDGVAQLCGHPLVEQRLAHCGPSHLRLSVVGVRPEHLWFAEGSDNTLLRWLQDWPRFFPVKNRSTLVLTSEASEAKLSAFWNTSSPPPSD